MEREMRQQDVWVAVAVCVAAIALGLLVGGLGSGQAGGPAHVEASASQAGVIGVTTFTGLAVSPAPVQVITQDATIRAIGSNQPISATAATSTSAIQTAGVPRGQVLFVTNVGAQTITITDTGATVLSGNAALGQHDVLELVFDGSNWLQVGKSDN